MRDAQQARTVPAAGQGAGRGAQERLDLGGGRVRPALKQQGHDAAGDRRRLAGAGASPERAADPGLRVGPGDQGPGREDAEHADAVGHEVGLGHARHEPAAAPVRDLRGARQGGGTDGQGARGEARVADQSRFVAGRDHDRDPCGTHPVDGIGERVRAVRRTWSLVAEGEVGDIDAAGVAHDPVQPGQHLRHRRRPVGAGDADHQHRRRRRHADRLAVRARRRATCHHGRHERAVTEAVVVRLPAAVGVEGIHQAARAAVQRRAVGDAGVEHGDAHAPTGPLRARLTPQALGGRDGGPRRGAAGELHRVVRGDAAHPPGAGQPRQRRRCPLHGGHAQPRQRAQDPYAVDLHDPAVVGRHRPQRGRPF